MIQMIDRNVYTLFKTRFLSKENFMKKYDEESVYQLLHDSKCGYIKIKHSVTGKVHYGITAAFGENIACYMSNSDEWFTTSTIQSIDWDNHTFKTLNSVYEFEFKELSEDKIEDIKRTIKNRENESKNQEAE